MIREEYAETIDLNESLGAPSARAMQKLFAAIDAEPARKPSASRNISARISGFFASLSPRTLAWSASLGALALLLQAGVIGAVLMKNQPASFQTASLSTNEPITRALGPEAPPRALVRFAPDARVADITALLDNYQASIVDARGGMFRLQFGNKAMSKDEIAGLMSKLQSEKIVSLAVADAVSRAALALTTHDRGLMVHDRCQLADEGAACGAGADRCGCCRWHVSRLGGSGAKHHALAQPQHRLADSQHQRRGAPRINPNIAGRASNVGDRHRSGSTDADPPGSACSDVPIATCPPIATTSAAMRMRLSAGVVAAAAAVAACKNRGNGPRRNVAAGRAQPAHRRQRNRGRDRRLAVRRAGRRTGAASRPGADCIAEFSADRRHHRPVPHHRPPPGGDREPRIRRRRQRSLGAAELPLCAAGPEGRR